MNRLTLIFVQGFNRQLGWWSCANDLWPFWKPTWYMVANWLHQSYLSKNNGRIHQQYAWCLISYTEPGKTDTDTGTEEWRYNHDNRGISSSKLVKGVLLLLAWKPFLFGFRSTTYKTSYDFSWKTYEADVKDQSILFNHQSQCRLRSPLGTYYIIAEYINNLDISTTWND